MILSLDSFRILENICSSSHSYIINYYLTKNKESNPYNPFSNFNIPFYINYNKIYFLITFLHPYKMGMLNCSSCKEKEPDHSEAVIDDISSEMPKKNILTSAT